MRSGTLKTQPEKNLARDVRRDKIFTDILEKDDKKSCTLNKWNMRWGGLGAADMEKTEVLNQCLTNSECWWRTIVLWYGIVNMDHITDAQLLCNAESCRKGQNSFYTLITAWGKMPCASVLLCYTDTQGFSFTCLKCVASVNCTIAFWRTLKIVGNKDSFSERLDPNVCSLKLVSQIAFNLEKIHQVQINSIFQ